MTEAKHPDETRALALAESARFCEFLDATDALASRWPHSRASARRWLEQQCGIESLGWLATDRAAADRFGVIAQRFAVWERNQELAL